MSKKTLELATVVSVIAALLACGDTTSGGNLIDGEFDGAEIRALNGEPDTDTDETDDTDEEQVTTTCFRDRDGDQFGSTERVEIDGLSCPGDGAVANDDDCDDSRLDVKPGASEVCDGVDNDCDGNTDENCDDEDETSLCREDADRDGFGRSGTVVIAGNDCDILGYADLGGELDCDDGARSVNPGATEVCNGIDDDCDGIEDEGCDDEEDEEYFRDGDGDGFGDPDESVFDDSRPSGYVDNGEDCDDGDEDVNPNKNEICDDKDNDCDGQVDEGCPGDGADFCNIRVTFDGDSSVDGDSSYYAEIYLLAFDGSSVINAEYWPTAEDSSDGDCDGDGRTSDADGECDWSNNAPNEAGFTELLSVTNGGRSTGTASGIPESFDTILLQGGAWQSSTSNDFIQWIVGNYEDTEGLDEIAGSFSDIEYSCGGAAYRDMNCVLEDNGADGFDFRCRR